MNPARPFGRRMRRGLGAATALTALITAVGAGAAASSSAAPSSPPADVVTVQAADGDGLRDHAAALVAEMSTAEQASSIVMGHIGGTDPAALRAYMQSGLGGFILMGGNIPESESELRALTAALTIDPALPPLIAVDQEGGIVSRLPWDTYPASPTLKSRPVAETAAAFAARGALVARAGITVDFGTVADVPADPGSFIFGRALGTDPQSAADRTAAATKGQEHVVASTLKHFPGHGAAPGDSHHAIPSTGMTKAAWREADGLPFAAGIEAGASLLMYGHLAYTAVDARPASLSAEWHRIARDELGFDGVSVTDDLGMLLSSGDPAYADPVANGVAAVAAGNDLVLMIAGSDARTAGEMAAGIAAAVDAGTLPADRLADAATRVLALRLQLSDTTSSWSVCGDCAPAG
ncbi:MULTISPECIES: glycoside hydrolase family 3 N-terminal domain-containing protein [unclassified Microbacterium]|uniref:glycoside hydrolase family 3 N-terminal domain-containing protein n=1 Tax=unclassified Microbacterium TaxID=2609290 RepID=UPI0024683AAC|nr:MULTISPECIES: glycoside hydrolase family 3 N-terminal domain-containing protein [unclassified Microbacterium]MDH5131623.1 glycoside hydrolase family 3 N-terminal domain-containing protein [Microbacterium sp. RD10]MDH5135098.1 glycoside hydrolase family 3 N-terminal domain-containing protein [Microbacterium sp. RD11]MDH5144462.1 glycoside hydrolase family 3 N-terminal domain-containing protein [Microbacterium sp. RD12]MDH5153406.1 glycoside hydrolase family 3 N-terminal domain-containing prot